MKNGPLPCATCEWWVKQDYAFHSRSGGLSGQCRASPPLALVADGKVISRWPLTADAEFCGKHTGLAAELPF